MKTPSFLVFCLAVGGLGLLANACKCGGSVGNEIDAGIEEDAGGGEDGGTGGGAGGGGGGGGGGIGGGGGGGGGIGGGGGADDGGNLPDGGLCVAAGQPCETGRPCCAGSCNGLVCTSTVFCKGPGGSCASNTDCCLNNCASGTCAGQVCADVGKACTAGSGCCTQLCDAGFCADLPAAGGTGQCKVLGQACTSPGECCSNNCQGGICLKAYYCQPNGDICTANSQCCGQACSANDGGPGRCQFITGGGGGGCAQEGNPCDSSIQTIALPDGGLTLLDGGAPPSAGVTPASNCCSRICFDPGSGTSVCMPAGGCRLTGTSCSATNECCGGAPNPNGTVVCQDAPTGRCDNGQACNGVGNICGASVLPDGGKVNASQNCCDGRKEVCKLDSSGIPRCFGGCTSPSGNCDPGSTCPTGYTGVAPCCIAVGDLCQFKGQCCDGAPCIPAGDGGLRCTVNTCTPVGATCTAASECCNGTYCLNAEIGSVCQNLPDGGVVLPDGGVVLPDAGVADAGGCKPNDTVCASAAECCSGQCIGGLCKVPPPCQPQGAVCTTSGDCCSGNSCVIPAGASTGTCQSSTCASGGQPCSPFAACCGGLSCVDSTFGPCTGTTACLCSVPIN